MASLIVKNGSLVACGDSAVIDTGDGAPCACSDPVISCWLQLLPCGCDDIHQAVYTWAGLIADQPVDNTVLRTTMGCFLIIARFKGSVPIDKWMHPDTHGEYIGTERDCEVVDCSDFGQGCPLDCSPGLERYFHDGWDDYPTNGCFSRYEWCAAEMHFSVRSVARSRLSTTTQSNGVNTTTNKRKDGTLTGLISFANDEIRYVHLYASGISTVKTVKDGEVITDTEDGGTQTYEDVLTADWYEYAKGIGNFSSTYGWKGEGGVVGMYGSQWACTRGMQITYTNCSEDFCDSYAWESDDGQGSITRWGFITCSTYYGRYLNRSASFSYDSHSRTSGIYDKTASGRYSQAIVFTGADSGVVVASDCPDTVRLFECDGSGSVVISREDIGDKPFLSVIRSFDGSADQELIYSVQSAQFADGDDPEPVHKHYDYCEGEAESSPVWIQCTDNTVSILVDETDMPDGTQSAFYQGDQYVRTPATMQGPVQVVAFSSLPCAGVGTLWRRCNDVDRYGRAFADPTVLFLKVLELTGWYDDPQRPRYQCRDWLLHTYQRVENDDGRDAPSITGEGSSNQCDPTYKIGTDCRFLGDDAGDPSDPSVGQISQGPRRGLPLVNLDGFDPQEEARRAKQGGCCGQPNPGG